MCQPVTHKPSFSSSTSAIVIINLLANICRSRPAFCSVAVPPLLQVPVVLAPKYTHTQQQSLQYALRMAVANIGKYVLVMFNTTRAPTTSHQNKNYRHHQHCSHYCRVGGPWADKLSESLGNKEENQPPSKVPHHCIHRHHK